MLNLLSGDSLKTILSKVPARLFVVAGLLLLVLVMWTTWTLTLRYAVPGYAEAIERSKDLDRDLKSTTRRLARSQARQDVAEREAGVIRRANQLLRDEERDRQSELQQLQNELDFFRRLSGTSGTQSGLAIYYLTLAPTGSERVFRFELTLTQNLQRSAITSGSIKLVLEGVSDDRPVSVPWSDISREGDSEPEFRFKYFQQIQGYVVIPDLVQPERLVVTLNVKGQRKPIHKAFNWSDLISGTTPLPPGLTESE